MNQNKIITLAANIPESFDWAGMYFKCVSSTGRFQVKFDNEEPRSVKAGRAFIKGKYFSRVEFISPAANTIEIFVGNEEVKDDPQVVTIEDGTITSLIQVAPTVIKPPVLSELAANTTSDLIIGTENANGRTRRKTIIVTNLSADLELQVLDSADNWVATVMPKMPWAVETDASVKLNNDNGETILFNLCEIFYIS